MRIVCGSISVQRASSNVELLVPQSINNEATTPMFTPNLVSPDLDRLNLYALDGDVINNGSKWNDSGHINLDSNDSIRLYRVTREQSQ